MTIQPVTIIRVASLVMAALVMWLAVSKETGHKKRALEQFSSVLVTWALWFIGVKILTTWPLVLEYPLSVLAYPSGTSEFYLASLLTIITEFRGKEKHRTFQYEYILLLACSFFFFTLLSQLLLERGELVELVLFFVYLAAILLCRQVLIISALFSISAAVSVWIGGPPSIMGYRMDLWFYVVISLALFLLWNFEKRREV
ncbi:hypothetical protein [Halobacillus halophilus]|uniref:hypothetical protein n=1 Tax=Halobacillus halophilus TaxID=1570 RepID=UPI001CD27549|nr:hypothetical protein [Halobacillus halophilus]MCA1011901.1 hypothetical protein [Halobacillus halophilus]